MLTVPQEEDEGWDLRDPVALGMPPEIVKLSNSFPMGLPNSACDTSFFIGFVPNKYRALQLIELYYSFVTWMYVWI